MWGVEAATREIYFGLVCQKDIDAAWEVLRQHLPPLGISLDLVRVEATGYVYHAKFPPPTDIFHCVPPEVVDPVTGVSTPGFGGLYFQDGDAYIYLLQPSQELGEMLVLEETSRSFIENREVYVLQGRYTWEQLMAWYDAFVDTGWTNDMNIEFIALEPDYNRIQLQGFRGDARPDLDVEKIKAGLARVGVPCDAVFLNEEDDMPPRIDDREKVLHELSKLDLVCDAVIPTASATPTRAPKPTATHFPRSWPTRHPYAEKVEEWARMARDDIDELDEMLLVVMWDDKTGFIRFGVKCLHQVDPAFQILVEHGIPDDAMDIGVMSHGFGVPPKGPDSWPDHDLQYRCSQPEVVDPVTDVSYPGFGGLYVTELDAYVYLLDPSQRELAEDIVFDEVGDSRWIRVLQGQYTWEQLREWYYLIEEAEWREDSNIRGVALRPEDNRVTLIGSRDENGILELDIEKIKKELVKLGIPFKAIILDEDAE